MFGPASPSSGNVIFVPFFQPVLNYEQKTNQKDEGWDEWMNEWMDGWMDAWECASDNIERDLR
jgi:hypothetical protein